MFPIDLEDAYFQIPIYLDSHPYLPFVLESQVFQFRVVCFSLSMAPQVFTRVFSLISEWAHQRGVHFLRYLDNGLIVAESLPLLFHICDLVLQLFQGLGIVINWEKLDLQPTTRVQYLGMVIDTSRERVFPSYTQLSRFLVLAVKFLTLPSPPARMWQQLLGHIASQECFPPRGRSPMPPLQWRLKDFLFPMSDAPSLPVPLSLECTEAIRWWLKEDKWLAGVLL